MSKPSTTTIERDQTGMTPDDWRRLDSKTATEITAAALADGDARLLAKVRRHRLGLTRERFAAAHGMPLDTLRAWAWHTAEPTPTEFTYLRLVEREPELAQLVPAT